MKTPEPVTRVVLIGAARSGTKIMRDALAAATGAGAVPYDIGFVWRVADPDRPDDVLDPRSLTPRTRGFVRAYVDRYAAGDPGCVIEKTVGNTLRVPFVADVFPGARFLHLVRDGTDVAESTCRQWRAPADYRYLMAKARHFPARLLPSYGRRYVASLLHRRASRDGRVATWGPRYPGIDDDLATTDLLTVCARQWRESVRAARRDLAITGVPAIEIRYEELISDPVGVLARAAEFCGLPTSAESLERAGGMITPGRRGAGARALRGNQLDTLELEIGDLVAELGYQRPSATAREEEIPNDGN